MTETTETGAGPRPGELAGERRRLEERAEAEMAALVGTLGELRALDHAQRRGAGREEARNAWVLDPEEGPSGTPRLFRVLDGWIADRLGGPEGFANLQRVAGHEKTLAERDPLTEKA